MGTTGHSLCNGEHDASPVNHGALKTGFRGRDSGSCPLCWSVVLRGPDSTSRRLFWTAPTSRTTAMLATFAAMGDNDVAAVQEGYTNLRVFRAPDWTPPRWLRFPALSGIPAPIWQVNTRSAWACSTRKLKCRRSRWPWKDAVPMGGTGWETPEWKPPGVDPGLTNRSTRPRRKATGTRVV